MMKLGCMFIVGILFIVAGFLGNLGSMIGALIDPGNMTDTSSASTSSTTSTTGSTS